MNSVEKTKFPYPGLRPFERDETDIFFGREEQTDELISLLGKSHFLAVVGPSGCGKSSLVRTGLLAGLESGFLAIAGGNWQIAEFRPGKSPFAHLAESLNQLNLLGETFAKASEANAFLQARLQRGPLSLHEILSNTPLPENTSLLLLVDQFEEIFRYYKQFDKNEATAFIKFLLACSKHPNIYIVITMRSDFIGDCAKFYGLPEAINQGQYLTPRLTRKQLREAIELPAAVFGDQIEPALVNHLLNEADKNPDQLPVLQHALMRMWTLARNEKKQTGDSEQGIVVSLKHYEMIGGLTEALSRHADKAYAELNSAQQHIAEILFRNLSERSNEHRDTRRPVKLETVARLANVSWQEVATVVEVFRRKGRSFLTPPLDKTLTPDTLLDISHESLIRQWKRLKEWTEQEAESAKFYQRLEEDACNWKAGKAALLRTPALEIAIEWRDKNKPTAQWAKRYGENFELAISFLNQSELEQQREQQKKKAAHKRELRRARQQVAWAIFGFIVAILLAVWGYSERNNALTAEKKRTESLFDSKITHSSLLIKTEDYAQAKQVLNSTYEFDKEVTKPSRDVRNLLAWFSKLMGGSPQPPVYEKAGVPLFEIAVSPDGKLLAAAGEKGTVALFNAHSGKLLRRLSGHTGYVFSIVFDPQGKWLASTGNDKQIILWLLSTGEKLLSWQVTNNSKTINALAVSPDGAYLASGGDDNNITLWNAATGTKQCTLKGHEEAISHSGLAFSPDGKLLASASWDKTARLWDVTTCQLLKTLTGHTNYVEKLSFSPNGQLLATSSRDKTIRLWDIASRKALRVLNGHQSTVLGLSFVANGQRLVSGSDDNTLRLWDIKSGKTLRVLQGHSATVNGVTSHGENIFSASNDGTVKRWNATLPYQQLLDLSGSKPVSTEIAPDGKSVAVGFKDGALRLYSLPKPSLLWQQEQAHKKRLQDIAFNNDGSLLATAGFDKKAKLWQVKDGTLQQDFDHKNALSAVAFSPNGNTLATASYDTQIGLFTVGSEQKRFYKAADEGRILSIAFDNSGTRLLTSGTDYYTRLWKINDEQLTLLKKFKADNKIMWASFSPDNKKVATVGREQLVRIYSINYGKQQPLKGHQSTIYRAIFSPDNQQVVTASADGSVRFWDLIYNKELFSLNLPTPFTGFPVVPLWDFDFRCTTQGCWIAVPLTHGKLALYQLGQIYR